MKRAGAKPAATPRFVYDGLDRIIHERARLSVLTSLLTHSGGLPFGELKELCALTDGNLNRHLQVLEEAGLVSISKYIDGNRTRTVCRVTALGRRRYIEYLAELERVLSHAAAAVRSDARIRGVARPVRA